VPGSNYCGQQRVISTRRPRLKPHRFSCAHPWL